MSRLIPCGPLRFKHNWYLVQKMPDIRITENKVCLIVVALQGDTRIEGGKWKKYQNIFKVFS